MSVLTRMSLANRGLVALVTLATAGFGLFATGSLKQELIPTFELPMGSVVTAYPGASPDVVEQQVTKVVEDAVKGVDGVTGTSSVSSNGLSSVQVEFEYGADSKALATDLQQALNRVNPRLPKDTTPQVVLGSTDDIPVVMLAASSKLGERELATRLRDKVVPELQAVPGVRDVQLSGARDEVIEIRLDEDELKDHGLSAAAVTAGLASSGVVTAGGGLANGDRTLSVNVGKRFGSVDDLADIYLTPTPAGMTGASFGGISTGSGAAFAPTLHQAATAAPSPSPSPGPSSPSPSPAGSDPTDPTPERSPDPVASATPSASPSPSPSPSPTGSKPPAPPTGRPPVVPGFPAMPKIITIPIPIPVLPSAGAVKLEPVRLGEVADVTTNLEKATSLTRTNGQPSLGLQVTKTPDGNAVAISHTVKEKMASLTGLLGSGATINVVFDQAPFIEQSIDGLTTEGLLGLVFAVLVILLFLLSPLSTLVTAVSIPLSVLVALIGLYVGGYSLNLLTLGALTIAVGRVVDDSIVVLENIKRHLGYGEPRGQAIGGAVREVTGAVVASTITTVAVFAPIGLVGGQVGELFRPFAVTVTVALLASLLVSLTIIPVLAYWFLRPRRRGGQDPEQIRQAALARERRSPLQRGYVPVLRWATRFRKLTVLLALGVFAGTLVLAQQLKTDFLGNSGQNTYSLVHTMPTGTPLAGTDAAARRIEQVLHSLPQVRTYQVNVGTPGAQGVFLGVGSGDNKATYSVTTDVAADQAAFERTLRQRLDRLTGVGDVQIANGGGNNVQIRVQAGDEATLRQAAEAVERVVRSVPGTDDVENSLSTANRGVQVTVDREEAAERGLSEAQIGRAVHDALQGARAGSTLIGTAERDVLVYGEHTPRSVADLRELELTGATGKKVELDDIADVAEVDQPAQLSRIDGRRSATVSATPTGGNLGALTADLQQRLTALKLPTGASWSLGGVSEDQQKSFVDLGLALLAAIVIVFVVMAGAFRSLVQPLILLVAVPFAATGAIGLLLLTDTPLGVPAMIGVLMLIGIVVTNAIVLIDLVNQYRRQGMTAREAVIEGGRQRLRPILMTAVATICALVPMALGMTGTGGFVSQELALVVIGGLASSTVLTLVLVPTLYVLVEGFKELRGRRRAASG